METKKVEDLTEEERVVIIKLAEALSDLVQPYVDAFLYATEALGKLLAEIQQDNKLRILPCRSCKGKTAVARPLTEYEKRVGGVLCMDCAEEMGHCVDEIGSPEE